MIFLGIFGLTLILSFIVVYKLLYWSRHNIPNDLSSRYRQPFHLSDLESHRKYGKIVGYLKI